MFDFADGGAEDERTLRRNEAAFDDLELLPQPLSGAAERDLSVTLFGKRLSLPVIVGPTGLAGLFWPDGERCAARAAAAAGTAFCLSHGSVCTLEELAATGAAPRWMQVFVYRDRGFTRELTERAAAAGYDALVLTIDNQLLGNRERDIRNGFAIPPRFGPADLCRHGAEGRGWLWRMRSELTRITFGNYVRPGEAADIKALAGRMASLLDPVDVLGGRRGAAPDLDGAADPQGRAASGRGAGGRRARRRRPDRLQPWRPPARRRAGDASTRCRRSSMRSAAGSRSCSTAACAAAPTWSRRWRSAPRPA